MNEDYSRRALAAVAVMLLLPASEGMAAAAGEAVSFAPHRAIYDITLDRAAPGSGVEEISGRMVYELQGGACEGYTQNMRFVTRMVGKDGAAQVSDLRTSSWEDPEGKRLRFSTTQYKDDVLLENTQGDAARAGKNPNGISVDLAEPARKRLTLKEGIYFPIQHSIALIEAARAGRTRLVADLYDGSDKGEKVYGTNSVIGKEVPAGAKKLGSKLKEAASLDRMKSWPIAISYFEPGAEKRDAVPVYELAFRFFDNGVSSGLQIDYGEFSIRGELSDLSFLEPSKCDGPK